MSNSNRFTRDQIYDFISQEREWQKLVYGDGGHEYLAHERWLAILTAELGEVAKEICAKNLGLPATEKELQSELIQVAAVVVKWLENYPWEDDITTCGYREFDANKH